MSEEQTDKVKMIRTVIDRCKVCARDTEHTIKGNKYTCFICKNEVIVTFFIPQHLREEDI